MTTSLNLHRLFYTDDGYLKELRVRDSDQRTLSAAREKIRSTLKDGFRNWTQYVPKSEFLEDASAELDDRRMPVPKFRLQGSFAYHTVNDCQATPPQQIDQDDGMFLPVGFITANGAPVPRITSKAYFKIVDGSLAALCKRENWTLNPGGVRDKCVRVGINSRLHIDLPLYAIRDEAFYSLIEKSFDALNRAMADSSGQEPIELSDDVYRALDESEIALAHRKDGWVGSDPRNLELWFDQAIDNYGPIVRRLCRDFKGLRDARWRECELSSICIMAAVVQAVVKLHPFAPNRDDLALAAVAREMASIFAGPIENPVFPGHTDKHLCNSWTADFRTEVRRVFAHVADQLDQAIHGAATKAQALALIREVFGERIPDNEGLIGLVGAAAVIRQIEPAPQPKPMVPRTRSG